MNEMDAPTTRSQPHPVSDADAPFDKKFHELKSLLNHLHPSRADDLPRPLTPEADYENELAQVRLGTASGLFMSLRAKHPATAAHCVRVAIRCSAWATAMQLSSAARDALEVAALLHDVGKIGVPDRILLKPSPLTRDEQAMVDRHWQIGKSILETCCNVPEVIEIVEHAPTWFDGTRLRRDCKGSQLPAGARMLAIVDAFDSMTTAQVYRPAMSHERALHELWDLAGRQFDPELVLRFAELFARDQQTTNCLVGRRWLEQLEGTSANSPWLMHTISTEAKVDVHHHFQRELLDNMYDGVIFLDAEGRVTYWNRGAERLTGISEQSILQSPFSLSLLNLRDVDGKPLGDEQCLFLAPLREGGQSLRRVTIRGRNDKELPVDAHAIPISDSKGTVLGLSLLLHDASGQASLEERCQELCEKVKHDPLTQLANRAEFDRVLALFVSVHLERRLPCSLVICDLDKFKHINDVFGHLVGDEVIKSFSRLLKSLCHPGDLVARFGGEEFVILLADCDNPAAVVRAEEIRHAFSTIAQPSLGGKFCTASFGVTELQAGDDAQTMLNRADRALLMAKDGGRNRVVQLGSGLSGGAEKNRRRFDLWRTSPPGALVDRHLLTRVPLGMALEKLRGFISDHQAEVAAVDDARVELIVYPSRTRFGRRESDRAVPLLVELEFKEERTTVTNLSGQPAGSVATTRVHVCIGLIKDRDRRRADVVEQARRLTASVRAYLIADEIRAPDEQGVFRRATSLLMPWLKSKPRNIADE
ncbi:MAG: diguanylate cyclase [Pirellulales bacterium]|nr:diguanylate cyclase [Pirellulales bacterium]